MMSPELSGVPGIPVPGIRPEFRSLLGRVAGVARGQRAEAAGNRGSGQKASPYILGDRQGGAVRARSYAPAAFVAAALVALGVQSLLSAVTNSATADESEHIVSGLAALRTGDFRMSVAHPALTDMILGAAAWAGGAPPLPVDDESWRSTNHLRFSHVYFWRGAAAPMATRLVVLARLPVIVISLGLALLVFIWARRLYRWPAAALALLIYCFEPNLLAHSSVATNDLAVTAGMAASVYGYWRYLQSPARWRLVLVGLAAGATFLAKFSGVFVLGLLPVLGVAHAACVRKISGRRLVGGLAAIVGVSALVVWAGYGFGIQPIARFADNVRVPAGQYISGLWFQINHEKAGHPAYLLGRTSAYGWWYYFPVAFLVKTPLPLLILLGIAVSRGRLKRDELFLAVPAALFFVVSMVQNLNYGIRHILPVYPFLAVFAARTVALPWPEERKRWGSRAVILLAAWMVADALLCAPQYLSCFNGLVGGPAGGSRVLADSNIDWGQDLMRLAAWQRDHPEAEGLHLAYFGSADPSRYGVKAEPLPGISPNWPAKEMPPAWYGTAYAARPGWIAVSINCLRLDPRYGWLAHYRPVARAGRSILIYHIEDKQQAGAGPIRPSRRA